MKRNRKEIPYCVPYIDEREVNEVVKVLRGKWITTGEGGMIVTDREAVEQKLRMYSLHGISENAVEKYKKGLPFYDIAYPGFKANLTDIQAALGVVQIRKLGRINRLRNQVAEWYDRFLGDVEEITIPVIKEYNYSARHLYPILLNHEETPILSNSCPKGTASVFHF